MIRSASLTASARPRHRRFLDPGPRVSAVLVLLLLAVVLAACDAGSSEDGGITAAGVVVDVQGSITEVEQFVLALPDGSRLTLEPESGVLEAAGFSASHLREHMALAERISVTYHERDGRNIVTGVDDAGG